MEGAVHSEDLWRNEITRLVCKHADRLAGLRLLAASGRDSPIAIPIVECGRRQIRDWRTARYKHVARVRLIHTGETPDIFGRD
ncbi:hypothetical protein AOQ72_26515 [Bradyrhizobium yuanmingense]|uniref:Uncharacterized protein n=1 Tax=Bradyrhizobium yuanmingense TaxID=108015 RepID=A0A0R3C641_9BRAD|nr:hypothetical protein AOQ72_26515 [Bradyrhizobium yuanmingense]